MPRPDPRLAPDVTLARLLEGNQRFAEGTPRHTHESLSWRHEIEEGQHPFATILGCADSRVAPELIFDQGLGDLFVVRVAGNVVDADTAGSIEYAIEHLGSPLVLVMGHARCGAVTAALELAYRELDESEEILTLLRHIVPAVRHVDAGLPVAERVQAGVEANVLNVVRELSRIPAMRRDIAAGRAQVAGSMYDLHTGRVRLLASGVVEVL